MLIKLSAILTIIPILNVFGETLPSISYISQEQIKDIGGSVLLQCAINDAKDYNVAWVKIGNGSSDLVIISVGSALVLRDSRFTFRYNSSLASTYTIQIMDIQETDAGIYQCRVILPDDNKITADVNLHVRRPPTILLENSTQSLVTSEGNSVQMECYADGYPAPTIIWRRKYNALLSTGEYNGNILKIASIRKEDRGTYYCVADNGVGKADRLSINLIVGFAPVITVPHPSIGQALQYDKYLGCHVEAYPPPDIVWFKEENHLSTNEHYSLSNFATTDELTDTILRVITIEKQQYGDYYCLATNKYGSVENKINLYETSVPTCTTDCDDSSDV